MGPYSCVAGDARKVMADLPTGSVDAVVTDPPYGLSREPDVAVVLGHWLAGDDYVHTGSGFMGESWDSFVPGPAVWRECLRVLKPGGHLLCFAGTRTFDLMGISLRLAGFEIRDTIEWMYGTGFPKSQNVAQAIDRRQMAEVGLMRSWVKNLGPRDVVAAAAGVTPRQVDHWVGENTPCPQMLSEARFVALCEHFGQVPDWSEQMFAKVGPALGRIVHGRSGGDDFGKVVGSTATSRTVDQFALATDEAKEWSGWGTALKPAHEPIILARKSIEGTVASNVLAHRTGAINIDASRIHTDDSQGRFPSNVILTHAENCEEICDGTCPARLLDQAEPPPSRFFYCAKTSKEERNRGLPPGKVNDHPTVKPVALMRYLVTLITAPGGTVLDPFMGSGSTGVAALAAGLGFVGVDQDDRYVDIARDRLHVSSVEPR